MKKLLTKLPYVAMIAILFLPFVLIILPMISFDRTPPTCPIEEEERQQEEMYFVLSRVMERYFLLHMDIDYETGRGVHFSPGLATQRLVDMYNYISQNLNPPIQFDGRDIVVDDIFENTIELRDFVEDIERRLSQAPFANWLFLSAWNNGYIDHDDVDGCWRGNGDWSKQIDERIAQRNER